MFYSTNLLDAINALHDSSSSVAPSRVGWGLFTVKGDADIGTLFARVIVLYGEDTGRSSIKFSDSVLVRFVLDGVAGRLV